MTRSETLHAASLAAALAALLMASSCVSPEDNTDLSANPERNHPIAVVPSFAKLTLAFGGPSAGLRPDDEARLTHFVQRYLATGNGSISVSAPRGPASSAALRYFGERLAEMGVPPSNILVGTHDRDDGARVELGFITYRASTAPCGDWSTNVAHTFSNRPTPNFGCATQHNLAAMVTDPRDLVAPRQLGRSDASRRTAVMGNYEKGSPTAAQKTADQSTNVSGIK